MMKSIERLDRIAAAGALARAALSLEYFDWSPSNLIDDEEIIRANIIEEARSILGISVSDDALEAIEKIGDFLDQESDRLIAPPDMESALARMAERGDLPSDLYEISIIENVSDIHRNNFALEKDIIETTIRAPMLEQHYGPTRKPQEPAMVSLFVKWFRTKWPLRDFAMLVAAKRDGLRLRVHQSWRIYPSRVDLSGVKAPVDWLRRFAAAYGAEVEVAGEKGTFFLFAQGSIPNEIKLTQKGKPKTVFLSRFTQRAADAGTEQSALIVAIDLDKYRATLDALGVKRRDFIEPFVPAPRARD